MERFVPSLLPPLRSSQKLSVQTVICFSAPNVCTQVARELPLTSDTLPGAGMVEVP